MRVIIGNLGILLFVAVFPGRGQVEATRPGTGLLVAETLRYEGKDLTAGMPRAAVIEALGAGVKTTQKPRQTTSLILTREQARVAELQYRLRMMDARQRLRTDRPLRTDDIEGDLLASTSRLAIRKCGVCWMEVVEKRMATNETIRITLMGPSPQELTLAMIILDKRRNTYSDLFSKPWIGVREVYLIDRVQRITQDPGGLKTEDIDVRTGRPVPAADSSPSSPQPTPGL